jgi:TatD DNase family protein
LLIDTHCHLNLPEFPDPDAAIAEAHAEGVTRMIVVGIDVPSSLRALEIAEAHDGVYAIVGLHPNSAAKFNEETISEIDKMLAHRKAVAIGEIGLDYHWDFATPEQQRVALFAQLDLAERTGKPVVFHCRDAYPDLLTLLEGRGRLKWLFHCFAGSIEDARRAVELDSWFGVDGPITYPKANDLRDVMRFLPRDRIVIETDAPYLSPVPYRGKPNRPAHVRFVNDGLAACLGINSEECAGLTTGNAERFFGL